MSKKFVMPPLLPKNRVRVIEKSIIKPQERPMTKSQERFPTEELPADLEIQKLSNLDLDTLIKLFKSERTHFRPILYKALYKIIENDYYKENFLTVNQRLNYYNLEDFTNDLFGMKEYAFVKEIIKIADKIEPYNGIYDSLIYGLWEDQKLLEIYFKMEPLDHEWDHFDEDLEGNLEGMGFDTYDKYFIPVLKAAINTEKKRILEYIIEFWNNNRENYEDEELDFKETNIIEDIDSLIEKAEMIVSESKR